MANGKSHSARRREVRRTMPRPSPSRWRWLTQQPVMWAALYMAAFTLVGSLIALVGRSHPRYEVGRIVTDPIVARVEFRAEDKTKTDKKQAEAYEREPAVYVANTKYFQDVRQKLAALIVFAADASIESIEQIKAEDREKLQLTDETLTELRKFVVDGKPNEQWQQLVKQFMDELAGIAVLKPEKAELERDPSKTKAFRIVIKPPTGEESQRAFNALLSTDDDPANFTKRVTPIVNKFPMALRRSVMAIVMQTPQPPTYLLDKEETERRRVTQRDAVEPVVITYQKNELLKAAGERLMERDLVLLQKEAEVFGQQVKGMNAALPRLAAVGLVLLIGAGLWLYIVAYNQKITHNATRGLALVALMLVGQVMAVTFAIAGPSFIIAAVTFPTLLVAVVLAITYDQRFAMAVGAVHALLVAISLQLPVTTVLVVMTGVVVAVCQLREVRSRSKLVWTGIWTGLAMGGAAFMAGLVTRPLLVEGQIGLSLFDGALAAATGAVTGLLVQGILPAIEKAFKVTTAMTLKDLNDASHPLLRRLAQDAPGTYQHSLRLADLAESAAAAIGADSLLCKVGAMYHDIGKMNKPLYFVENQGGGPNRHGKLSPAMSVLIIVGHVKDGIEMAREYHLPPPLRHFIESHHGTTLVEYFYHAARKKSDAEDTPGPSEFEFRYPGPKPQTREAAILMLGDAVESAARTLPEPTPIRLEQLVHTMAVKRLMDGQFDECNLTLKELHKIEEAITKTLCAIYHGRVRYPSAAPEEAAAEPQPLRAGGGAAS